MAKNLPARRQVQSEDPGSIPESGRPPGEGSGYPLQYCLENPMDRGAWWATVHGVIKSQTLLTMHTHTPTYSLMLLSIDPYNESIVSVGNLRDNSL